MNAPGIYRSKLSFEQGFTRIPNTWLRDSRIGFRAKGLLAYLLSHEVGYTITLGQIERETNDGRHAIRSAVDELVSVGYLQVERTHNERGWNAGLAWFLSDPNPESENPKLENPTLENQTAIEENLKEKKTREEVNPQASLEEAFLEFWSLYPRKVEKIAARKAFFKASKEVEACQLVEGARRLANDPNLPAKQFIKHPATWLNCGGWLDEPFPERVKTPEEKAAEEKARIEKARQRDLEASRKLRAELAEAEARAKADPPKRCVHDRIAVMCEKCRK